MKCAPRVRVRASAFAGIEASCLPSWSKISFFLILRLGPLLSSQSRSPPPAASRAAATTASSSALGPLSPSTPTFPGHFSLVTLNFHFLGPLSPSMPTFPGHFSLRTASLVRVNVKFNVRFAVCCCRRLSRTVDFTCFARVELLSHASVCLGPSIQGRTSLGSPLRVPAWRSRHREGRAVAGQGEAQ